jgi:hypothetical protein
MHYPHVYEMLKAHKPTVLPVVQKYSSHNFSSIQYLIMIINDYVTGLYLLHYIFFIDLEYTSAY